MNEEARATLGMPTPVSKPSVADAAEIPLPRFLTRQALFNDEHRIVGYELGINQRAPRPVLPGASDPARNQDELLIAAVLDLDYREALSGKRVILGLSAATLVDPLLEKLPSEHVIIALPLLAPTPALVSRCQALSAAGYALALDAAGLNPATAALAECCRYLRLDVGGDPRAVLDRLVPLSRGNPRLIATNVASAETYAACRKLSFELYQGDFFSQPGPLTAGAIDAGRLHIMQTLNLVVSQAEIARIEACFKQDAALSLKLLRFINSPGVGLRYPVRSLGHALLMLGHDQLYRWLTLLLFVQGGGDGRGQALLRHALVRARLVELLGESRVATDLRGGLFIVGILSLLDVLLRVPMQQALAGLNLAEPIVDALLRDHGAYFPYLALARACESGMPDNNLEIFAQALGLGSKEVNDAHLAALAWAEAMDT